jgi:P-type conjugative transfer protein TrbJ
MIMRCHFISMGSNKLLHTSLAKTLLLGVILATSLPRTAHAQFGIGGVVFDPKNLAQAVLLYNRVLDQLTLQRQQLQAQIAAMQKLAAPPWRDIQTTMSEVDALTRQGQAISYSLQNLNTVFSETFPGTLTSVTTGGYPAAEQTQTTRTLATLLGTLTAAQRAAAEFPAGLATLRAMKSQVGTVQGHEQALELNGTIDVYSAEQLTMLSQQIAALTNAEAVYYAHQVNTRAQTEANVRAFLTQMGTTPPQRPGFSYRVP